MIGFSSRKPLVGIDIGSDSVKVVRLGTGADSTLVTHLGYARFPRGHGGGIEETALFIRDLLARAGLKGEPASLAFSSAEVMVRYFSLPRMPEEELRQAVSWEAAKHASVPVEDLAIDYIDYGRPGAQADEQEVIMAVLAPRALVDHWLAVASGAGVRVRAVDVGAMALLAYADLRDAWEPGRRVAVIDLGHGKTGIHIFQDRALRFTRDITLGGEDLIEALVDVLQVDRAEAERLKMAHGVLPAAEGEGEERLRVQQLLEQVLERIVVEIQRSFDYFQAHYREEPVDELRLTGGTSLMPGLPEYVSRTLGIEAVSDEPWRTVSLREDLERYPKIEDMGPLFAAGVGLATRRAGE